MSTLALIDTQILDYLLAAWESGEKPLATDDELRAQQTAVMRAFLWTNDLAVGRVATEEVEKIGDAAKRRLLLNIAANHLGEVWVQPDDQAKWDARAAELNKHHRGRGDCRVVAEAEIVGATFLLSFDRTLVNKLQPHTPVRLLYPSDYWTALAIPRGTPPLWRPTASNPLSAATFWRWE